jgi:putative flippase GtrA
MPDEATTVEMRPPNIPEAAEIARSNVPGPAEIRPHLRLVHGLRRPANWLQLVRFGVVGGVGFAVNLAVYAVCVRALGIDYHVAAVAAWLVAVMNNFVLNRHWTFDAGGGRAGFQAVRFVAVSLVAFGFSLILLTLLVESVGVSKVPAQALAVAASTPLNFLGNKLWSFRAESERIPPAGL